MIITFKHIVAIILMFLYIYKISYSFFPFSSTVIFGIFGLLWFLLRLMSNKIFPIIDKTIIIFLLLLLSIGTVSTISLFINNTVDIKFISYMFSQIAILFASYFVVKILKKIKYKLDFEILVKLIINVIFIQSIIALSMFLIPDLKEFLLGLENLTTKELARINSFSGFRIYGVGLSKTFLAGVYNGYALILIAILFRLYRFSLKGLSFLSLKFTIILLVGMMMARTTLAGALIAIIIILIPRDLKATLTIFKKRILFFTIAILIPIGIVSALFIILPSFEILAGDALRYGFEMFINLNESGSFETESSNELMKLYVLPNNIQTYIIGDGYFADPIKVGSYYMHTDIGYLRLIYYFGGIGLSFYLAMQIYLIVKAYSVFNIGKGFYIFIIVYFMILNLKGFTDLLVVHIIFIMVYLLNKDRDLKISSSHLIRKNKRF